MSNHGPNFSTRPVLRVDLKKLQENFRRLSGLVGKTTKVAASVKADAYGLGAGRVGRALYGAGCRTFFVATSGEGKILREAVGENASIYVLNGPAPRDITLFFGSNLKPVINSMVQAHIWAEAIENVKQPPFCAIHIDTGMNRLGFAPDEFIKFSTNKKLIELLRPDHIMSHLACASNPESALNLSQHKKFLAAATRLPVMPMSMANTAGLYLGSKYHFQFVRPGIGLYGGKATENPAQEVTEPVVSLMAPILQIRHLKAGETLGYNATFTAKHDLTAAIVGAGYADGVPFSMSSAENVSCGFATIQKQRVPILGRVSMDLTALDISNVKKLPRIGDWAAFLGNNLESDAQKAGTITYELLARIGQRVRREYL